MTKVEFFEYFLDWLSERAPHAILTLDGDFLTMELNGVKTIGFPQRCPGKCGDADCKGWVMVTHLGAKTNV